MTFATTQSGVLAAGQTSVSLPACCTVGGTAGNAAASTVTVLVTCPAGIETVNNPAAFTGGKEEESDTLLRSRILDICRAPSNGTNAEFYRRSALEVPGVYAASAIARADGIGTVKVYLWGQGETVSDEIVQLVQQKLEALQEINVDITVAKAQAQEISVSCYIAAAENTDFSFAQEQAVQAVRNRISVLKIGETLYRADLIKAILDTGYVRNCSFGTLINDYTVTQGYVGVAGTVTVGELT